MLKPSFFVNEELAALGPLCRLLFQGLWCLADREGRLEDRPRRIKAEVLPYDDCDVNRYLDDLAETGFIERYEVDGQALIQVVKFRKHQTPHIKEAASTLPPTGEHRAGTVQAPEEHRASTPLTVMGNRNSNGLLVPGGAGGQRDPEPIEGAPSAAPKTEVSARASPKPNRLTAVIDLVQAAGVPITATDRDGKAIKGCSASPEDIATAYVAAFRGDWDPGGNGWLQGNLALHVVIARLAGYQASKQPSQRTGSARASPPGEYAKYAKQIQDLGDRQFAEHQNAMAAKNNGPASQKGDQPCSDSAKA